MSSKQLRVVYWGKFQVAAHGRLPDEQHVAETLERMRVTVLRLPLDCTTLETCHSLCVSSSGEKADLFLLGKQTSLRDKPRLCKAMLNIPKSLNIPTLCWIWDLYHGKAAFWNRSIKDPYFSADYIAATYPFKNWTCIRQGINSQHRDNPPRNYKYEVGFVGGLTYKWRSTLVRELSRRYTYTHIGGDNPAYNQELTSRLAECKIIVGDSVPCARYWSNRVYEVTGRGAFLIHPSVLGFSDEWPSVPTYYHGDLDSVRYLVDRYLDHDTDREALRHQQFANSAQHTYESRIPALLNLAGVPHNLIAGQLTRA